MFIIRPAKIKDLPEIVKMRLELGKYHEALDNYIRMNKTAPKYYFNILKGFIYSTKKKLLVAESNGKLVGFGSALIMSKEPVFNIGKFGHIRDMYIDKKFRRQGVAGEILEVFYKWFKEKNINYIELSVVCNNKLGREAWTKYGFKDFKISKRKIFK